MPRSEITGTERGARAKFQDRICHGVAEGSTSDGRSGGMAHDYLEMLDCLGRIRVVYIQALNVEGAKHESARHIALDA